MFDWAGSCNFIDAKGDLSMVTQIKDEVLVLTDDGERVEKLRRKLREYVNRGYAHRAPEVDPSAVYRYRLLALLLNQKIVDLADFKSKCTRLDAYHEAVTIIRAYNSGDHTKIDKGTGLS